jgi:glutathione S-transferase
MYAAIVGIFWPIGRILFARGYVADPKKRGLGFGISLLCSAVLLVGTVIGIVLRFING